MRVCGARSADLAQQGGGQDAGDVGPGVVLFSWYLAHLESSEILLEVLVQRELDRYVREAEEGGSETGVEGCDALGAIHLPRSVHGILVVPGCASTISGGARDLRHQAGLDDPDGIGDNGAAGAGEEGGVDAGEPLVLLI